MLFDDNSVCTSIATVLTSIFHFTANFFERLGDSSALSPHFLQSRVPLPACSQNCFDKVINGKLGTKSSGSFILLELPTAVATFDPILLNTLSSLCLYLDSQTFHSTTELFYMGFLLFCLVFKSCPTLTPHGLQPARLLCPCDFPGKNIWSGLPFPSPEDLPNPRIEPASPALAGRFFTSKPPGKLCFL